MRSVQHAVSRATRAARAQAAVPAVPAPRKPIEISLPEGTWACHHIAGAIAAGNDRLQRALSSSSESPRKSAIVPEDTAVVSSISGARTIARQLLTTDASHVHAIDTEVACHDLSSETPIHHGILYCVSIYCGETKSFTVGESIGSRIWIDLNKPKDEKRAMLSALAPYLESEHVPKVWHNYGYDRHILENYGLRLGGFHADTMHMARLHNPSRKKGYKLDQLAYDFVTYRDGSKPESNNMDFFKRPKIKKDGSESAVKYLPSVDELQTEEREDWINYSTNDAKLTWELFYALNNELRNEEVQACQNLRENGLWRSDTNELRSLWDFYTKCWAPFGNMLTEMEKTGVFVDKQQLSAAEERAKEDKMCEQERFRRWAQQYVDDAGEMNVNSGPQIRQVLFKSKDDEKQVKVANPEYERWLERQNQVQNSDELQHAEEEDGVDVEERHPESALGGLSEDEQPSTSSLSFALSESDASTSDKSNEKRTKRKKSKRAKKEKPPNKWKTITLHGTGAKVEPPSTTATGEAQTSASSLQKLAGKKEGIQDLLQRLRSNEASPESTQELGNELQRCAGTIYAPFEELGKQWKESERDQVLRGLEACEAMHALCDAIAVDHLLSNFIEPLQSDSLRSYCNFFFEDMDEGRQQETREGRVHCTLNINTETGRLSAKRPNLQNQPALAKDRYNIRSAFRAENDRRYVIADYGQLELRLLAHMTNCKSMLDAFQAGGDFHSRTAADMFDHISEAINKEEAILEWEGEGEPTAPIVKDMFADERKKAKVLNFSIAYGKTAFGLANDWNTGKEEAQKTLDKWYNSRPEVRKWQKEQEQLAQRKGYVYTLLGRKRHLPDALKSKDSAKRHALRAAINTPIQGGAADIVSLAMLNVRERLQEMFPEWKVLLQVHDEVILEGPKESAEQVEREVVDCMQHPFKRGRDFEGGPREFENLLNVDLAVDSNIGKNWMECK